MKEVYIVAAQRTPMGSFMGGLSNFSATELGARAIKGALEQAKLEADKVQEVYFGNVVSAGLGQAPARQAAIFAGLSKNTVCTTINKVCASGMKSVALGAMDIMTGEYDIVVAGGMESMSNAPHYLMKSRFGYKYGDTHLIDGLAFDGLLDVYNKQAMGVFADKTAEKFGFTREAQDEYAINSYKKAASATENGYFRNEITGIEIPQKKGNPIVMAEDEEYKNVFFDKIPSLKPAFSKEGTVTAANASTINDGASALILVSEEKLKELNLTPLARIVSFADAEQEPEWFTTAPTLAAPKALKKAGLTIGQIDYFEVNEAFANVAMSFAKVLEIDANKMNVFGGAVALGHPLGSSGSRILVTLNNVLHQKGGKYGLAAICNGGGGASAMIIEKL
jgi:acetyl-CoA C-acetyltransferase